MARVSAVVDTVKSTESKPAREVLSEVCQDAIERTVAAGALRDTVKVVEKEKVAQEPSSSKEGEEIDISPNFEASKTILEHIKKFYKEYESMKAHHE